MRPYILILLGALAACSQPEPDPRGVRPNEVLLQISATGRSETRPDEARFVVGVTSNAPTAGGASTTNNETMNRVIAAMDRLGIDADQVQTRSLTLSRIDYGAERGRFRADNTVEVRVRDLKVIGQAIAAATEAGGNVIQGPDLRISDPERADNAGYAAAYKAARARADAYAAAAGLKVKRVIAIRDGSAQPIPFGYGYGAAVDAAPTAPEMVSPTSAPPVRGGVTQREVRVRADFALGKK